MQNRFVLNQEDWNKFLELINRPAVANPKLHKLLTEPTVLDK
jgi:uncharacterized protein (DUF1778 family)